MGDHLTEINRAELPRLRDLYSKPSSVYKSDIAYITIDSYIRCFQKYPNTENITFYCLNSDFSHGTFVVTVSHPTIC